MINLSNLAMAQSIKLDHIVAISDDYILSGATGINYKFADIQTPKGHTETLGLMADLLLKQEVRIEIPVDSTDRYSRLNVHIYNSKNIWINAKLVELGFAQLSGAMTSPDKIKILRDLENNARQAQRGLWKTKDFQIYKATPYDGPLYAFVIVEGTIFQVKKIKRRLYLNFEDDWQQDFSVTIDKSLWNKFNMIGINLAELTNKKIQARGWVRKYNGPYLEIRQIGQLNLM